MENEGPGSSQHSNNEELILRAEKRAAELEVANKELAFQNEEKAKRAAELELANVELAFQNEEKAKRAAELELANLELAFQNREKAKRAAELELAYKRLAFKTEEKAKRAAELELANVELSFQNKEKAKRADELELANVELAFQSGEKAKRAAELEFANKRLAFQNEEKAMRAAELELANVELAFQNAEKAKRADELELANKELAFQHEENLRLNEQLFQSQKMESLGILAGGVAHDMNNVLGAILGLSSAVQNLQVADSPAWHAFDTITKAATRGGQLVKSLLAFTRNSLAEESVFNLNEILHEEVQILTHTTLARVRLTLDLDAELRPIRGDAAALTHAIMNLCVNAVDAMPEQGSLTLRTRNIDNEWVEVVVEDTGSGMSKEVLKRAFEPFFTTKGVGKGTGLGLAVVYRTVKAHCGQMEIQSEPNKGTRVGIKFPTCNPSPLPQRRVSEPRAEASPLRLSVLLVDDDELIQSAFKRVMELLGHAVTVLSSGEDALAKLETNFQPDVVILDMNMPGFGGVGTLPRLRALRPTLPVILSTGRMDQTAIDLAEAHPYVTLLPKPFSMRELQENFTTLSASMG